MKKSPIRACPSSQETVLGMCYFAFQLLVLPGLLTLANGLLTHPLRDAELNFLYYALNFAAVLVIFRDYLADSANQAVKHPAILCQAIILGLAAYYACRIAVTALAGVLVPSFSNYNDASIAAMQQESRLLVFIGTVILVPPAEECFFRGLIFRNLYGKSPWAAYLISMLAFSMIHIVGYWGSYTPGQLLIALLQYLPAGLCLAWSYTKAGTLFAPIAIHALVNFLTLSTWR